MRRLILACTLLATICAYHIKKNDFNVVIQSVEYTNLPHNYILGENFVFPTNALISNEQISKILTDLDNKPRSGIEANVNEYADKIFANLKHLMVHQGLDPMELPDQHSGFNYTLIITYHGELDLTKGWLSDISSIHRGGDVLVLYSTTDRRLEIVVPIAFDDLQFTYDYSAKIMGLGPTGSLSGKVANVKVNVKLVFDTAKLVASLETFQIVNSGHIDLNFHGNPLVDWLINLLTDVVTALLKPLILGIVEVVIRGGLENIVDTINSAIDGILNPTTTEPAVTQPNLFVNHF